MLICLHAQVWDVGIVFTAFLSQIKPTAAHNKLQIYFALLEILRVDAQEYQFLQISTIRHAQTFSYRAPGNYTIHFTSERKNIYGNMDAL